MFAALVVGRRRLLANEFSSKQVLLLMVDCWIECSNSDHLVKYLGSYLETRLIRRQWAASFSINSTNTFIQISSTLGY